MQAEETRASRNQLAAALEEFKQGADRLNQVWSTGWQDGNEIDNYPKFLPSFDEAVLAFRDMSVETYRPEAAVEALADLGATLEHTGGGCMVGAVYFETHSCGEGPYVWITDAAEYDGVSEGWLVGYYPHAESDGQEHVRVTTEAALREAVEKFRARPQIIEALKEHRARLIELHAPLDPNGVESNEVARLVTETRRSIETITGEREGR